MASFDAFCADYKTPVKSKFNIEQHYLNNRFKNVLSHVAPQISILVINVGLSGHEKEIIDLLPSHVSLALTSYFKTDPTLFAKARERGHEIYLTIPAPSGKIPGEVNSFVMSTDNFKRWATGLHKEYQGLVFEQPIDGHPFYMQSLVQLLNDERAGKAPILVMVEPTFNNTMLSTCQENKFQCAMGDKIIYAADNKAVRTKKLSEALSISKLTGKSMLSIAIKSIDVARELAEWLSQIKKDHKVNIVPVSKMMILPHQGEKAAPNE